MRSFLLRQKFRFDMGYQFMALVNFTLLVIAASDKLSRFLHIRQVSVLVVVLGVLAFGSVWLFGYLLDRLKFNEGYSVEATNRTPVWIECMAALGRIEDKLEGE